MIKGNLVNLRFPEPADHRKLVKWRNENLQYFFSDEPVSIEKHLDWYERVSHNASQRFFVIETIIDNRSVPHGAMGFVPIGTIGLQNVNFHHRHAEYGRFLIAEEHRGKGYGKDALATLLNFAFATLGLHKVYGDLLAVNLTLALRLCDSLGFQNEGIFKDHVFKGGKPASIARLSVLDFVFYERLKEDLK